MFKALEQDGYLLQFVRRMSFIPTLINSVNSSILFTFEEDLSLPFLDVFVQRQTDETNLASVFQKATHIDNYST